MDKKELFFPKNPQIVFRLPIRPKIIFGEGSIAQLGKEVEKFGPKTFLVCGSKSLKENGILEKIIQKNSASGKEMILRTADVKVILYDGVPPEPNTKIVDDGLKILRKEKCSSVISIGGGSVIDVGKAIAGLYGEFDYANYFTSADYLEIDGTKKIERPGLPFISVPTVSGTGAEITMNSVLINSKTGNKRSVRSESLFAKVSIIDPELTLSVPPYITAVSGIDALCHLLEGYISKKSNDLSDPFAIEGMKLVIENLPKAVKNGKDLNARKNMAIASLYSGMMIVHSGLTVAHGIGSIIGPKYRIPHGLACAIILPQVLEYNLTALPNKKIKMIKKIFGPYPEAFIVSMLKEIKLETKLSVFGIKQNELEELAHKSLNTSSTKNNPLELTVDGIISILERNLTSERN